MQKVKLHSHPYRRQALRGLLMMSVCNEEDWCCETLIFSAEWASSAVPGLLFLCLSSILLRNAKKKKSFTAFRYLGEHLTPLCGAITGNYTVRGHRVYTAKGLQTGE